MGSLGSWIATRTYLTTQLLFVSFLSSIFILFLRLIVNIIGLVIASTMLSHIVELKRDSVLFKAFSFVISNARGIGDVFLAPTFNAFQGSGNVLDVTCEA